MDTKARTIQTYNQSAQALAEKFDRSGARVSDVEEVLALIPKMHPHVLEIGCGNGRDADIIRSKTDNYLGIDISQRLIELARKKVPRAIFEIADIETYQLPSRQDVVFAFASLIHVPKAALRDVFERIFDALNPGGSLSPLDEVQ